jgi:hypothetical protein
MADFISLHPEEWAALISGLRFSAAVAQAKIIFIPVVIFVLGLSLFIWLQRLEKEREWNAFVLWLIFSTAIILSAFRTQKVVVELNPIVLNSKSMMLSIKREEVKVNEKNQTLYHETAASGVSALLAIPDKLASLMFNFMDANLLRNLAGQTKTVPLDNVACKDPRYVAGLVQMLTLDWALGLSMQKDDSVEAFSARVDAFSQCYQGGFSGLKAYEAKVKEGFKLVLNGQAWAEAIGRGLMTLGKFGWILLPFAKTPVGWIGAGALFLIGAVGQQTYDLIKHRDGKVFIDCEEFRKAFQQTTTNIVNNCEKLLGVKWKAEEKEAFVNSVLACLVEPDKLSGEAKTQCLGLREKTLTALETAKQAVEEKVNIRSDTPIKNFLAGVVSDVKAWWFSTTYMDFPLKFDLLAKGQGIVLAILAGLFPFVAVLSVIPVGRHFMNWPLLLNFMIAYFMVKMWIPLLSFIVNVATHNLARITGG